MNGAVLNGVKSGIKKPMRGSISNQRLAGFAKCCYYYNNIP